MLKVLAESDLAEEGERAVLGAVWEKPLADAAREASRVDGRDGLAATLRAVVGSFRTLGGERR
ncbi:hypothetical protein [Arthrobacter sp. NicSoilB8]|uniref:hypothetical protein n=1 Tax=Arthrobacter sp. NicSoilB8 TaxID=2830998 RepID=UPI001CC402A5|nr:hypothetical protein [Arthrobacter sp. NicSoilB8]